MNKKSQILSLAEHKVRAGGYSNFSFRELADEIGIKSSSVHYYFRTKGDLGAELAKQYTDTFIAALDDAKRESALSRRSINMYIDMFKCALKKDNQMCLCGLLGAQSDALPDEVKVEIKRFFEKNIDWLKQVYIEEKNETDEQAKINAIKLLATLEGMMILSKALNDFNAFDAVADVLV